MNTTTATLLPNTALPKFKHSTTFGIRTRLFIGFSAILLVLVVAIAIVLYKITSAKEFATQVIDLHLPTYEAYLDLHGQIFKSEAAIEGFVLTRDTSYKTQLNSSLGQLSTSVATLDDLSKKWPSENLKNWLEIKSHLAQLKLISTKIENLTIAGNTTAATQALATEYTPTLNKILDSLDGPQTASGVREGGLYDAQYKQLHAGSHAIITDMDFIRAIEYALLVLGVIISILIAYATTQGVLRYINMFRQHSKRVSTGDLTQRILIESNDEMGQLGDDLNLMTDNLAVITKQITEACHNMVTTVEEVKHSIDVQSSGVTEQAASINEITASLEEIEKSSVQTMDKAKTLGDVADRTRAKGQLGLEAVEQSTRGMKAVRDKVQLIAQTILELSTQTQQVGEITSVVNMLAQQSKMLALNASIEAAKAGEAGKGFAVVAAEVKNLAEQSEQSTAQVQKILEDIRHATEKAVMVTEEGTKGVDEGTNLVEQTGDIVRNLNEVIHETTIATQQIQTAIHQEGIGIEQISAGMNEIQQVTSSFVESVKNTTEAINNLSEVVHGLKKYVDTYKI